jgi:hypothetical protein
MKKKKHTQSAGAFAPSAAQALVRKLHTPARHALTPRESSLNTLNSALDNCRSLVGLVSTTGPMLSDPEVMSIGKTDDSLVRLSNALLKDLRSYKAQLADLSQASEKLNEIRDDMDFLPAAIEVGQKLVDWETKFRQVVIPLNAQVHDRISELVTPTTQPEDLKDV